MNERIEALGGRARALVGPAAAPPPPGPRPHFSAFDDEQLSQAVVLANRFWQIADETGGDEGVARVLDEVERLLETELPGLVRYALQLFMTHHPLGRLLPMPTLAELQPETAHARMRARALADADPSDLEAQLWYLREDELANEHHWHWHRVYPHRRGSEAAFLAAERQSELFIYMHQQMLARYDAERLALGLEPVEPLEDYSAPIPQGYQSSLPGPFPSRDPGETVSDEFVAFLTDRRREVERAIASPAVKDAQDEAARIAAINLIGHVVEAAHVVQDPVAAGLHNNGHGALAALSGPPGGVMRTTTQAIRDPVFWRWHRHIDDFAFNWQESRAQPADLVDGAAPVEFGPDAIVLCSRKDIPGGDQPDFGFAAFGEQEFGASAAAGEPGPPATDELLTRMVTDSREVDAIGPDGRVIIDPSTGRPQKQTIEEQHLEHDEFVMFFRVQNTVGRPVGLTLRVFLVPDEHATERRQWVEMDKFHVALTSNERKVVARPGWLSSVVRKPARMSGQSVPTPSGENLDYCECGWPYNLLVPRGTPDGMPFKLAALATDNARDGVPDDRCGSVSFCGVRTRSYPDRRPMGYPFDLPFDGPVVDALQAQPHAAVRDLTIRLAP
jgi:tyrosinase